MADAISMVTLVSDGLSVSEGIQTLEARHGYSVKMYMAVMYTAGFRLCIYSGAM